MPKARWYNSGPNLNTKDLNDFEKSLGSKLPKEYRRFLRQHNGGIIKPACFTERNGEVSWVSFFYYIDKKLAEASEDSEYDAIAFGLHKTKKMFPRDVLVIGVASRDDYLLLGLSEKKLGKIYLQDMMSGEKSGRMRRVANSIDEFLSSLHVDPDLDNSKSK